MIWIKKKGHFVNKSWEILENKNMVHSKIDSYTSNYLGDCQNYYEVEMLLNKNQNIDYFTWHKPSIRNKSGKIDYMDGLPNIVKIKKDMNLKIGLLK